ncbi:MAG TPA: hypothetical protein VK513_05975, partial [Terriglobales bacterium]|nr:hypothetical protein [Terriglobales bacterium]
HEVARQQESRERAVVAVRTLVSRSAASCLLRRISVAVAVFRFVPISGQERTRWRGGRFACTKSETPVSLEGQTVARYDDVNMESGLEQCIDEHQ